MAAHGLRSKSGQKDEPMRKFVWIVPVLIAITFGVTRPASTEADRKALAEEFFRGVYGCDPSVVDQLAGDDVVISYPIFETLFDRPGIRGRDAVRGFATNFCKKWTNAQVTIHDSVSEGDKVVLVWGFKARNTGDGKEHEWGGLSLFRLDESGKIVAEMGLESTPGPFERMALVGAAK